eukprot:CAMPEP_0113939334 /NCGR_PEP_ID=MMETSP1339-20121228/5666_1 /TAXON_ID=94617 /ORGANISM="Fibrocapsa japonica" /LENGTH=153 /DNA_ID=CAMNT_0000942809 /DNA_START=453 /DNA_END=914 /DNA_ORIENTATION=+ /assembly_acc=CAM_ASM_000762
MPLELMQYGMASSPERAQAQARDNFDYVEWIEKLKKGVKLIKVGRDLKRVERELVLSRDGTQLNFKGHRPKRYFIGEICGVRKGNQADGTEVLRKSLMGDPFTDRLREMFLSRSFSLMFPNRSLDFICSSVEEMHWLVRGFDTFVSRQRGDVS